MFDGDEVYTYGTDPFYQIEIKNDSEILNEINQDNKYFQLSLQMQVKGKVLSDVFVRESAYSDVIQADYVLGIIPEILYATSDDIAEITISFQINEDVIPVEASSEEFKGVNRYNIFKYIEE